MITELSQLLYSNKFDVYQVVKIYHHHHHHSQLLSSLIVMRKPKILIGKYFYAINIHLIAFLLFTYFKTLFTLLTILKRNVK